MNWLLKWLHEHFIPSHRNAFRPRILHRSWLIFFLVITLGAEGFLVSSLLARQSGQSFLASVVASEVISLTNTDRQQNAISTLQENPQLDAAAQAKADDMAAQGYFSHVSPDGKQPWDWITAAGYNYQDAGENLAVRFVDSKDVVNAWMASPTHRANILKPVYTNIGVGVASGRYEGQPATFVVQYFGTPEPGAVAVVATPQSEVNSLLQSFARQMGRLLSEPRSTAQWILGAVALILAVAILLALLIHIQVQPTQMLLSGVVVAGLAIAFLSLNMQFLSSAGGLPAAVGMPSQHTFLLIGEGVSAER